MELLANFFSVAFLEKRYQILLLSKFSCKSVPASRHVTRIYKHINTRGGGGGSRGISTWSVGEEEGVGRMGVVFRAVSTSEVGLSSAEEDYNIKQNSTRQSVQSTGYSQFMHA